MKVPANVYTRSSRVYRGLDALTYPLHDGTFTVTQCGRICFHGRKVNLSHVFCQAERRGHAGRRAHLARHLSCATTLGYFDDETCWLEPIENPFGPKVLAVFNPSLQRSPLVYSPASESKSHARPGVQAQSDGVQLRLPVIRQVCRGRQILAQQAVRVLV